MNLIADFWNAFQKQNRHYKQYPQPPAYHFCDNKKDADECAELVLKGIKQASSPSVWWFRKHNEKLPEVGDLAIVTNWDGEPKAIIRTLKIEIVKFKDITPEYAFIEGEGDRSLAYWKAVHWKYYASEMKAYGESPDQDMEIVCEYFKTIR